MKRANLHGLQQKIAFRTFADISYCVCNKKPPAGHYRKEVRAEYREHVRKYLWGDSSFWSGSYFIASTGSTVLEKVREYIDSQRTEEHERKYVRSGKYSKKKRNG